MIWPYKNKKIVSGLILTLGITISFQNCAKAQFGETKDGVALSIDPKKENTLVCQQEFFLNGDFEDSDDSVGTVNSIVLKDLVSPKWDLYTHIPKWEPLNWSSSGYIEIQSETTHAAASGKRFIELDRYATSGTDGSIAQKIQLSEGDYKLTYSYRSRPSDSASSLLKISWDENLIQSENVLPADNSWQSKSVSLISVASGTHVLRFKAEGISNGMGPHLDQVSIRKICPL